MKNLQRENRELKSKNKDLEKAWEKTQEFLSESVQDVSLEEIIKNVKENKRLKKAKKKEPVNEREEVRKLFAERFGRSRTREEET